MYYYPFVFYQEIYAPITNNMLEGIDPDRYLISNYGKVFDLYRNVYIPIYTGSNGYQMITLHTNTGRKNMLVHRLVGMAFIPGDWNLQINHKNGVKSNCSEENLEWVTARENLLHAVDLGLNYSGEDKVNAILTNAQVYEIAKLLADRTPIPIILNKIGMEDTHQNRRLISDVKRKKTFRRYTSEYTFDQRPSYMRMITNEQANQICEIFQCNPYMPYTEVYDIVGFDTTVYSRRSILGAIGDIYKRRAYKDISEKYTW